MGVADAEVDDGDACAHLPGDDVDGRSAGEEVRHHLRRHLPGPRRHALGEHAVVAGEDDDRRSGRDGGRAGSGDRGEADAQRLQASERAGRFGEALL